MPHLQTAPVSRNKKVSTRGNPDGSSRGVLGWSAPQEAERQTIGERVRITRLLATAALILGAGLTLAAPAQAAPAQAAPAQSAPAPHRYCTAAAGGQLTCSTSAAEITRTNAALVALVTFYVNPEYDASAGAVTFYDEPCSGPTTNIDYAGPIGLSGISSVKKYTAGHCNWQLIDANGTRSTWVEGSWSHLSNLGNNWNNRGVRYRLT
jgi:hypothetical protein